MNRRALISIPLACILLSGCANLNANLGKVSGTAIGAAAGGAIGKGVAGKKRYVDRNCHRRCCWIFYRRLYR